MCAHVSGCVTALPLTCRITHSGPAAKHAFRACQTRSQQQTQKHTHTKPQHSFEDAAPGPYDVVVDTIGGEYEARGLKLLKPRGGGGTSSTSGASGSGGGTGGSGGGIGSSRSSSTSQQQQQQQQDRRGGLYVHLLAHGWNARYGPGLGLAATLGSAVRGTLAAALRLGPDYRVVAVRSPAREGLEQVARLIGEGRLKPVIDCRLPLARAAEAHARSEAGHARGKIVLEVAALE